jgi:hypothetical protein
MLVICINGKQKGDNYSRDANFPVQVNNMTYKVETDSFLNDLERVTKVRYQVATSIGKIAETLKESESEGKHISGELG